MTAGFSDKSVGLSRNRPQQVARAQEPEVNFVVAQHSNAFLLKKKREKKEEGKIVLREYLCV